jgi:hypothetical protein
VAEHRQYAIYRHLDYGPTFGHEIDFSICDRCDLAELSYTQYECTYACNDAGKHFTMTKHFRVREIEVFQIME